MSATVKMKSKELYKTIKTAHFYRCLLLRAMVAGKARWEPFAGDASKGEVCVGGMRYSTELDETGCPLVHEALSSALYKEVGGFPCP